MFVYVFLSMFAPRCLLGSFLKLSEANAPNRHCPGDASDFVALPSNLAWFLALKGRPTFLRRAASKDGMKPAFQRCFPITSSGSNFSCLTSVFSLLIDSQGSRLQPHLFVVLPN